MDFTWEVQGATPTTIDPSDKLQFADGNFDGPILATTYNESTHVKTSGNADKSAGNTPNNNKFISQANGTGGDSQVDVGAGTVDLDAVVDAEAVLKINITDVAPFSITDAIFYSYDGLDTTTPAPGVVTKAAEVGNANFTDADNINDALELGDQGSDTSHDYFIILSKSPASAGLKTGKDRIELTVV